MLSVFWPTTPAHEVCPGMYPVSFSLGEKMDFLSLSNSQCEQFLGKGWGLCLLPLPLSELVRLGLV